MTTPDIGLVSLDQNINAMKSFNANKDSEHISGGYKSWVWISLVLLLVLLGLRVMQTYNLHKAARSPAPTLADRYNAVKAMYWAIGAEVFTLVVGLVGINLWKAQMIKIEEAEGFGSQVDTLLEVLFYQDAAAKAKS